MAITTSSQGPLLQRFPVKGLSSCANVAIIIGNLVAVSMVIFGCIGMSVLPLAVCIPLIITGMIALVAVCIVAAKLANKVEKNKSPSLMPSTPVNMPIFEPKTCLRKLLNTNIACCCPDCYVNKKIMCKV